MRIRTIVIVVAACTLLGVGPAGAASHFTGNNNLPPDLGWYAGQFHQAYPIGVLLQNPIHRQFTQNYPPPPPGQTTIHSFGSVVDFQVSLDGGATYATLTGVPATTTARVTYDSEQSGVTDYDTELLQLDISGGALPAGVMIRESPTLASTGQTTIEPVSGGYMISSFFDVFTELSVDGGQTWMPADGSGRMEWVPEPTSLLLLALGCLAVVRRRSR